MELLKDKRFWVAVLGMGLVASLAFLSKIQGGEALSGLLGIVGGFSLGAKGNGKK